MFGNPSLGIFVLLDPTSSALNVCVDMVVCDERMTMMWGTEM